MGDESRSGAEALKKNLPQILVLLLLVLLLLFVITRFKWVMCDEVPIPGWCQMYCSMAGKSKAAIVYGDEGIGDPDKLFETLRRHNYFNLHRFSMSSMSADLLKKYEVVFLERSKRISVDEAAALEEYLASGGNMVWIGDAATDFYVPPAKMEYMKQLNKTKCEQIKAYNPNAFCPDYYSMYMAQANGTKGFGTLSGLLMARYVGNGKAQYIGLQRNYVDHPVMRGIKMNLTSDEFVESPVEFAIVEQNPSGAILIAKITDSKGNAYPGIVEGPRYGGKILFIAFPLEETRSETLIDNVVQYLVSCP